MTRIKIKLRLSTVSGRPGTVYYQISRKKEVKQITTNIRLLPEEWDASAGCVCKSSFGEGIAFLLFSIALTGKWGNSGKSSVPWNCPEKISAPGR